MGVSPGHEVSLTPAYFDARYAAAADPWNLATSWYERHKYDVTLASLPNERYALAYEPACSIGVLTRGLAARCDRLLAVDCAADAVAAAARAVADLPHVHVARAVLPEDLPEERFDLIVLSEFLYYLSLRDLELLVDRVIDALLPGGHLVCVHRRDGSGPWEGAEVHQVVLSRSRLPVVVRHEEAGFLLHVLEAPTRATPWRGPRPRPGG
ncbi:SAM-dependent methyltransferase [Nonomuraea sp. SYSU D8015]|uniref:SAM-dependent methyltransferase n=1 Tax=Nonomuraea sp. SYSU D8015 TaxID=2593644 RepID=UPI0016610613|nr:SAM-dependent methyltransferase [Nonomuraea sp. SYSU D8015]